MLKASIQQVVNNYYDKHPTDMMSELEQQASIIMKAMYDSVNNEHSDSISGDIDRLSRAVDSDYDVNDYDKDENVMPYDRDENVMPYDKDENVMPCDKDENVMPYEKKNMKHPTTQTMNICQMIMMMIKCPPNMTMIMRQLQTKLNMTKT